MDRCVASPMALAMDSSLPSNWLPVLGASCFLYSFISLLYLRMNPRSPPQYLPSSLLYISPALLSSSIIETPRSQASTSFVFNPFCKLQLQIQGLNSISIFQLLSYQKETTWEPRIMIAIGLASISKKKSRGMTP